MQTVPQQFIHASTIRENAAIPATPSNYAKTRAAPLLRLGTDGRLVPNDTVAPNEDASVFLHTPQYALVHLSATNQWGWIANHALHTWFSPLRRAPKKNWFVGTQHPSALLPLVVDVLRKKKNPPGSVTELTQQPPVVTQADQYQEAQDFLAAGGAYMADFEGKTLPVSFLDELTGLIVEQGYRLGWESDRPDKQPHSVDREIYVRVPAFVGESSQRRKEVIKKIAELNIRYFSQNGNANVLVRLIDPLTTSVDSLINIHLLYDESLRELGAHPTSHAGLWYIQAVPLVESADTILGVHQIIERYLQYYPNRPGNSTGAWPAQYTMPPSLLIFIAGSDINREAGFVAAELIRSVALSRIGRLQQRYSNVQFIPWLGSGSALMRSGPGAPVAEGLASLRYPSFDEVGRFPSLWGGLPRTIQPEALEQACLALRPTEPVYPRYRRSSTDRGEKKFGNVAEVQQAAQNLTQWIWQQPPCSSKERQSALMKMFDAFKPMMEGAPLPPILKEKDNDNIRDDEISRIALAGLFAIEHVRRTALYIVPLLRISSLLWPHNQVGRLATNSRAFVEDNGTLYLGEVNPVESDIGPDSGISVYNRPVLDVDGLVSALGQVLDVHPDPFLQKAHQDLIALGGVLDETLPRGLAGERAITGTFARYLLPPALTTVHTIGATYEKVLEDKLFDHFGGYVSLGDFVARGFPKYILDMVAAAIRSDGIALTTDAALLTDSTQVTSATEQQLRGIFDITFPTQPDRDQLRKALSIATLEVPDDLIYGSTGLLFRHINDINLLAGQMRHGREGVGTTAIPDLNDKAVYKLLLATLYADPAFQKRMRGEKITMQEWVQIMEKVVPLLAIPSWRRIG